jgi:hypothetical protein
MHDTKNRAMEKLLARLKNTSVCYLFGDETTEELVERMQRVGTLIQIDEATYRRFELQTPLYVGEEFFAIKEGHGTIRLFLRFPAQHFCRRLTQEQTKAF